MKALVVYDSFYGNTEKIAVAIGAALGSAEDVTVLRVSQVKPEQLAGLNLLIVGSPTRKFSPSPVIVKLVKSIPKFIATTTPNTMSIRSTNRFEIFS